MDLSAFDVTAVPDTGALQEQKELSVTEREQWILTLLEDGALPNSFDGRPEAAYGRESYPDRRDGLYDHARRSVPGLSKKSDHFIAAALRAWGARVDKPGARRCWTFPPLADMRRAWDDRFGPREWPGGQDAIWAPPAARFDGPQDSVPASER
jgi:hypothetical protein